MFSKIKEKYRFDVVCIISFLFLGIYSYTGKNILDFIYLLFFIFCYLEIKYYRWKKYH